MRIKSDDGDYSYGSGGSGGRGGYSGSAAVAYTANDTSGKYINRILFFYICYM